MTEKSDQGAHALPTHGGVTVTVRGMRAQNDGAEILVQVLLDNGEHREQKSLLLSTEQYYTLKPTRGVISEELYEQMEAASCLSHAIRAGENLLSYGANSEQMLARKLVQRGYSRETASAAAKKLSEMGLIDEEKDLAREVEKCLSKLWGAKRISAHLWSRGFSGEALSRLPVLLDEVDFAENCALLTRRHYGGLPETPEEQRRVFAGLARYGYTLGEIREAMETLKEIEN